MYNQYLDGSDFVLLEPEPQGPGQHRPQDRGRPAPGPSHRPQNHPGPRPGQSKNDLMGEITGGLGQLLDGVLKHFSLENFDTGDILLVLIILFLYRLPVPLPGGGQSGAGDHPGPHAPAGPGR